MRTERPGGPALDTLSAASTPEGLRFVLRLAGPYPRALAFAIDALIQTGLMILLFLGLQSLFGTPTWLYLIAFFLLQWFYGAIMESLNQGRTFGKWAVGIQVVRLDGALADFGALFLRNLVRAADMFNFCFFVGLLIMGASPRFQRLGDLAAGTIVIHRPRRAKLRDHYRPGSQVQPEAPPAGLEASQGQAIIAFAQRLDGFSPARAKDLAELALRGLYGAECRFEDPVRQLLAHAAWLAGHRPAGIAPEAAP